MAEKVCFSSADSMASLRVAYDPKFRGLFGNLPGGGGGGGGCYFLIQKSSCRFLDAIASLSTY